MTTGERLRTARKAMGLTQGKMAEEIGIALSTISDIERGKLKSISERLLKLFSEVFNIDPMWLKFGELPEPLDEDDGLYYPTESSNTDTESGKRELTVNDGFPDDSVLHNVTTPPSDDPSNTTCQSKLAREDSFSKLTPLEVEIINLYLTLSSESRQNVLTEFVASLTRHSHLKTISGTETLNSETESDSLEFFDISGNRIDEPQAEVLLTNSEPQTENSTISDVQ